MVYSVPLALNGELSEREVSLLLLLSRGLQFLFMVSETSSNRAGLFDSQIKRLVLLGSVVKSELRLCGLIHDRQNTGNSLSHNLAKRCYNAPVPQNGQRNNNLHLCEL